MVISPINTVNSIFNINIVSRRESATAEAKAGNVNSSQKARLYNPQTGEAMTPQEAEELFQQITNQPHWNRHDVNFYAGPPVAAIAPTEKQIPAASEDSSHPLESSPTAIAPAVTTPAEKTDISYNSQARSQLSETVKDEKVGDSHEAVTSLWNNRNYYYYQLWVESLAGNYIYDNEEAWEDFLTSPGRRFWDVKV